MFFQGFRSRLHDLERRIAVLERELSTARAEIAKSVPATIAADVENLRMATESRHATLAKTLQKLLGQIGGERAAERQRDSKPDRDALRSAYLPKPQ